MQMHRMIVLRHSCGFCRLGWKFPWAVRVHMAELLLPHAANSFGQAGVQVCILDYQPLHAELCSSI